MRGASLELEINLEKKKKEATRAQKSVFYFLELKLGEHQFGSCFTMVPGPEDKELRRLSWQPAWVVSYRLGSHFPQNGAS